MGLTIQTDDTPIDAAGTYEIAEGASLYYRTPTGREQAQYRKLSARLQDDRQSHIDDAPEPTDGQINEVQEARGEDIDDDEARRAIKLTTFVPGDDLRRKYLALARDITIDLQGVDAQTADGTEAIEWGDGDTLCDMLGCDDADEARALLIDRLGKTGADSMGLVYEYVAEVFTDQSMGREAKKN